MASEVFDSMKAAHVGIVAQEVSRIAGLEATFIIHDELSSPTVQYKPQTFEDRKTVFGAQLRISWTVPEMMVEDSDARLARQLAIKHGEQLRAEIKRECPDCDSCPKLRMEVSERDDFHRAERQYVMTASCRTDRQSGFMQVCPNGKTAVLKGHTALVAANEWAGTTPFIDIPGTSVSSPEPAPYIRTDPDKPTSDIGEAW
jgi:hypothetical protein